MSMTFADYMGDLPLENGIKLLIDCVEEGMSPFRVRSGDVYIEHDVETNTRWLIAEVRLSNGSRVAHMELVDDRALMADPAKEVLRVANLMLTAFRQRHGDPVSEKIVLGEN